MTRCSRHSFRHEADVKNLDPKYRKAALVGGVALASGAAVGGLGAARASEGGRLRDEHLTAGAASRPGPTGCHNCALQ